MQFEHLIEINSPLLDVDPLTRKLLWHGLVVRAEKPELFVMGLDRCELTRIDDQRLRRVLSFGEYHVTDNVRLIPMDSVIYDVEPTATSPASTLVMRIEEPAPQRLYLRFTYTNDVPAGSADEFVENHLKQAYKQADIDTVKVIRELASQGLLGER